MMLPFPEQARWYAEYHQKDTTHYLHIAGILFILLALMILLGFVHVLIPRVIEITLADIAAVSLLIYYFRLNWRLALVLTPIFIVIIWLAQLISFPGPTAFSLWSFVIIFLVGCILQFLGYMTEGKRPPFSIAIWQVLAAPMFLTAEVFFKAGKMHLLKEEIHGIPPSTVSEPPII
jgi:uncharacterized membrane protein YGL010W